jgi:hypothetical protein
MLVIGLVVFAWLVAFQVRAILRSPFPGLRAIEAPGLAVKIILGVLSRRRQPGDADGAQPAQQIRRSRRV